MKLLEPIPSLENKIEKFEEENEYIMQGSDTIATTIAGAIIGSMIVYLKFIRGIKIPIQQLDNGLGYISLFLRKIKYNLDKVKTKTDIIRVSATILNWYIAENSYYWRPDNPIYKEWERVMQEYEKLYKKHGKY